MEKEQKYELLKFKDVEFELDVNVSPNEDTVWLTQEQIAELFGKARATITEHINNIFEENELDTTTSVGISDISGNHRPAKLYNFDVINLESGQIEFLSNILKKALRLMFLAVYYVNSVG